MVARSNVDDNHGKWLKVQIKLMVQVSDVKCIKGKINIGSANQHTDCAELMPTS